MTQNPPADRFERSHDYSRGNGEHTLTVSLNAPLSDVLDWYADHYDAAELLDTLTNLRSYVEGALDDAVTSARKQGWSWERVGQALGVSRQWAHERYAPR